MNIAVSSIIAYQQYKIHSMILPWLGPAFKVLWREGSSVAFKRNIAFCDCMITYTSVSVSIG